MIIDASKGDHGVLIDLATGQPIRFAFWANLMTGEYMALKAGPDGQRTSERYCGATRLKWIPTRAACPPAAAQVEPASVVLPLRLAGRPRIGRRVRADSEARCETPTCDRLAAWMVSDEVELSPLVDAKGKRFERALHADGHYYCDWCYQPPRLFDAKGELIREQEVEARPA